MKDTFLTWVVIVGMLGLSINHAVMWYRIDIVDTHLQQVIKINHALIEKFSGHVKTHE